MSPEPASPEPAVLAAPPCVTPEANAQERWFKEEVHAHDGQLKAYLRGKYPAVRGSVEDVVQESYLRIWKARTGREIASAKAFLFTIARNLTLNLLRSKRCSSLVDEGDMAIAGVIDDSPNAADCLSKQEKIDLLTDALATLSDRAREILLLHK